jgi:hypothetical protein
MSVEPNEEADMRRLLLTLAILAVTCSAATSSAFADTVRVIPPVTFERSYVVADADDRFANPRDVQGVVTSFDRFNMTLRVNGREFPVLLHQGTIIRPTGTTLTPSMVVNIAGYWQSGTFFANRIVVVRW